MINGLSFRPRPIDVNRSIPIIRKELDEEDVETTGVVARSLPMMPTGMEAEDEEEAHIQEAIKQSLGGVQPEKVAIPTPDIKVVPGYDEEVPTKPFVRPQAYIRYKELSHEEWLQKVEYDLDPEDAKFIRQTNANKKMLSDNKFEKVLDRCEKEAARIGHKIPPVASIEALVTPEIPTEVVQVVYQYWIKKRERNNNQPLITDLIEPPDPEDPNPYKPFRRRTEEFKQTQRGRRKNDLPALLKMRQLRHEMERARTLLEQIKKREKLKKDRMEVIAEIFELQCEQVHNLEFDDSVDLLPPAPITTARQKKLKERAENAAAIRPPSPKRMTTDFKPELLEYEEKEEMGEQLPYDDEKHGESSDYSPSEGEEESQTPRPHLKRPLSESAEIPHKGRNQQRANMDDQTGELPVVKPPPFRGRVRFGRGGRVIIDRTSVNRTNGIVPFWESDQESYERLNSLADLHKSGFHPLMCGRTDAEKLLKKLLQIQQSKQSQPKRRRHEL